MSEKKTQGKANKIDGKLFRRILTYLSPYKAWVGLALVLSFLVAFLGPLRPKLVQVAIDSYIQLGDTDGLRGIIGILILVLLGESILNVINNYLTQWIGQNAIFDLRDKVFKHIERLPLKFFDGTPIGQIITRTTSDVEALNTVLSAGVVTILGNLLRLVFITYFMFALDWKLALLAIAVMPLMIAVTFIFRKKVRVAYRETRKQVARLNSFMQEHITGMHIIQMFNREEEELSRFQEVNGAHRTEHIKTIFYFAIFWPSVDIIASLALGLMIWYGGMQAILGSVSLGVLVAFIQYVRQFFDPIRQLSDQYNTLQSAMAASERIFGVLDLDTAIIEKQNVLPLPSSTGKIEFKNVWFAYDDTPNSETDEINWILRDISFTVEPGQTIALVGATGSGKSTILNVLLRFYEIQKGQILIDGSDIKDYSLKELRQAIGLVLQDVFLFSGTIYNNVVMDDKKVDLEMVKKAATLVGADTFIDKLPNGYHQEVKERGSILSHGQRQLLSFVRALVYNPAILVLDEATSSIDSETEELIQTAIDRLMVDRTTLAVAHRLSTIRSADQILVVHNGAIRERGSHQELLKMDGLYRRLYELQYRDQERKIAG